MNGNSKSEKVTAFVRRAVLEALQEVAWNSPDDAATLRRKAHDIQILTAHNCTTTYRLLELQNIMDWKKVKP